MEFFSKPIAQVNVQFFKEKMAEKLPDDQRLLIKECKEPYIDSFGRVTFFYIELASERLPIYQPGAVMFETAVKGDSEISVATANGQ